MILDFGLSGKKYLVTGASSGIGRVTAIGISKLGGKVLLNGRNENRLRETLAQMDGDGHHIMPFDMSNLEQIGQYVRDAVNIDGLRFDGLVFSTGVPGGGPIRSEKIEHVERVVKTNFFSYIALMKAFASRKILNDGGAIVAVSSKAALFPEKSQLSYASSKSAVNSASEVAAQELVGRKIRVNTVCPDAVDTPMSASFFAESSDTELSRIYPLGVISPDDVASSIIFLLSNFGDKITGQHIYISGGNYGIGTDYLGLLGL